MIIDTHSHIYLEQFDDDRDLIVSNAFDQGIQTILLPNIDSSTIERLHQTEKQFKGCIAMMGLHPTSVKDDYLKELSIVEEHLFSREYIGVGEVGIDLYWDKTFLNEQIIAFEKQIIWAKQLNLPVVIHCRDAFEEVFSVVDRHIDSSLKGVFHSFGGSEAEANHIMSYKTFKMGINGVVTFKKSTLPVVLKKVDPQFIILETDAPYLAPTPYRGKRNEPLYLKLIYNQLKDIYGMDDTDLEAILETSTNDLFNINKYIY